jgi:hypothetical protein
MAKKQPFSLVFGPAVRTHFKAIDATGEEMDL